MLRQKKKEEKRKALYGVSSVSHYLVDFESLGQSEETHEFRVVLFCLIHRHDNKDFF